MPARLVSIDHDTPLLLAPDLRDWVPEDPLVHVIMDAVGLLDLSAARVNHSGSGSGQFPPSLMPGLLIHRGYATGAFSSRRIEKHTCEQVAVRLLRADHHPDHATICAFRRGNRELLAGSFHPVPEPSGARWPKGGAFARRAAPEGAGKRRRTSGCESAVWRSAGG